MNSKLNKELGTSGESLAKALMGVADNIKLLMDDGGRVSPEDMTNLTRAFIENMNQELRKESRDMVQGALNVVLLALANYSLIERSIFEMANLEYTPARKEVLDKVYVVMSEGIKKS